MENGGWPEPVFVMLCIVAGNFVLTFPSLLGLPDQEAASASAA